MRAVAALMKNLPHQRHVVKTERKQCNLTLGCRVLGFLIIGLDLGSVLETSGDGDGGLGHGLVNNYT